MMSYVSKVFTAVLLSGIVMMCLNKILCRSEKCVDEKKLFSQFEKELLETYKRVLENNIDLRIINCTNMEKKSYKHHTPVSILATEGMVADLRTIYKCKERPTVLRKVSDGVYSIESFYNFSSFMYAYSTVNVSIHGIYNKSDAIFLLDTVLRANFTMGVTPAQRFVNVTKVELLNCTVNKQLIRTVHDMFRYMVPHVTEMFLEHFMLKEKLKIENTIKNTFTAVTNNSTFLLGTR